MYNSAASNDGSSSPGSPRAEERSKNIQGYHTVPPEGRLPPQKNPNPPQKDLNVYQMFCRICEWKSLSSTDPAAIVGLVAELEFHMKDCHPPSNNTAATAAVVVSAEREEFMNATRPRLIPEAHDDRNNVFSEGRHIPGSVNWKNCSRGTPIEQTPVLTRIDLSHIGVPTNDTKIIGAAHNRASGKTNKLDRFSDVNMKNDEVRKKFLLLNGEMTEGEDFVQETKTHVLIMACLNYYEIMRYLFPTDIGPQALFRVILEKSLLDRRTTPEVIKSFFQAMVEENARRVCRAELPLTYDDVAARYSGVYIYMQCISYVRRWSSRAMTLSGSPGLTLTEHGKRGSGMGKSSKNRPRMHEPPSKKKKLPYCGLFNKKTGCTNPKIGADTCKGPNGIL